MFDPSSFLQALRMQHIFGPTDADIGVPSQTDAGNAVSATPTPAVSDLSMSPGLNNAPTVAPSSARIDSFDPTARMNELYHPDYTAENRYNTIASNYPQDMGHSKLARLGAALISGFDAFQNDGDISHGFKTGTDILDFQRNKKIADWKNQITPLQNAADNERQANQVARQNAQATVTAEITNRRNAAQAQEADDRNKIAEERNKLTQFHLEHPDAKFDFSGPTIKVADPLTKQVTDTGIPTGHMSDFDKLNLQHTNRTEEIQTAGENKIGKWKQVNVIDPSDPTKEITKEYNETTGDWRDSPFTAASTGTRKATENAQKQLQQQQALQQRAKDTIDTIDELFEENKGIDPKTGERTQLASDTKRIIGASRIGMAQYRPGSSERTKEDTIQQIKNKLVIDLISEMKSQSRTGATGMGNMSDRDIRVLENSVAKLDPWMNEEDFRRELMKIRAQTKRILQPANSSMPTITAAPSGSSAPSGAPSGGQSREDKINSYLGG